MDCERSWNKKLQTSYPLGLNDNIMRQENIYIIASIDVTDIATTNLHRCTKYVQIVIKQKTFSMSKYT